MEVAVLEQPDSLRALTEYANIYIGHSDVPRAISILERAEQVAPRDAGPLLHQIVLRCQIEDSIDEVFERAKVKSSTFPLNAYALSGVEAVVNVFVRGVCKQLDLEDLLGLVDTMQQNPYN